jgi:uncharacterized membrane protein YeaQ/YmgE (transglycosylase-associated protein family)
MEELLNKFSQETLILWIATGFSAGIIAKILMPGKDKGGIISTILLGVIGSFAGGYIGNYLGISSQVIGSEINLMSFLTAIAGAFALLLLLRVLKIIF